MDVDVVHLGDDRIEELLEVDLVQDELMGELFDEPSVNGAMEGFDLSVGGRIASAGIDPAHAQDGKALTEYVGVIWRATIRVKSKRQSVTACCLSEDRDRGAGRL
jgi:hypothetical protein